jgi:hypothetical protein
MLIGIVLLALIGFGLGPWLSHDANYVARLQQRVTAELPVGTTETSVDKWLRANCKHLPLRLAPPAIDVVHGRDLIEVAAMPRSQVASMFRVTVPREDAISAIWPDYARVYFFFDQQGFLIGSYVLKWDDIVRMEADTG